MMNDMPMGGFSTESSAMISGKWINRQTGDIVNVRDSIIDGDNMILMTNIGQISMDEFSRNYIQASDDIFDESGKVIDHQPIDVNDIVITNDNTINERNNSSYYYKSDDLSNIIVSSKKEKAQTIINDTEPEEYKVLEKFFNKLDNPENLISIDIDFEKLPLDKLKTLVEYLDIDKEIIAKYMSEKFININTLGNIILNKVEQYL